MNKNRKRIIIIIALVLAVFAAIVAFRAYQHSRRGATVRFDNGTVFHVTIADDNAKQEQGLSGVASLKPNQGMLFVFDIPDIYGFWMKDMLFSLDFVWIDENWKVVDLNENISPDTYPQIFAAQSPVQYVLEIPAGSVEKFGIKEGSTMHLSK